MNIHGQFSCRFDITDQPFDEQFQVCLNTAVSIIDQFGNLASTVKTDICSKTFVIDRNTRSKCQKELDIRHLFSHREKKQENANAPKVILKLNLDTFSLRTHDSDRSKTNFTHNLTLNPDRVVKQETDGDIFLQGTNDNLVIENDKTSLPVFQAPCLLQETDAAVNATKKQNNITKKLFEDYDLNGLGMIHVNGKYTENENECELTEHHFEYYESESYDCDIEGDTNNEIENCRNKTTSINTFDICSPLDNSRLMEKSITDTEGGNGIAEHQETKIFGKASVRSKNTDNEPNSDMLEKSDQFEMTNSLQEQNCATLDERRYPKRTRKNKMRTLEKFYTNDEIDDHEAISTDDEENKKIIKKKKNLKRKRKNVNSDSDNDYVPSGMEDIPSDADASEEKQCVVSVDNNGTESETKDQKNKLEKIDEQIDKYKIILIEKGLEAKIPTEMVNRRLILGKLKMEVKQAERIKVDLKDHADKFEMKTFTSMEQKNRRISTSEKSSELFSCKVCKQYQTKTAELIRFHIEQHVNGELKCKWCEMEFSRSCDKRVHQLEAHQQFFKRKKEKKNIANM